MPGHRHLFALLLFLSTLLAVSADLQPTQKLSLQDAIQLAREQSPYLKAVSHEADADRTHLVEARGYRLPTVDVMEVYTRTNSPLDAFALQLTQEKFSMENFVTNDPNHPSPVSDYYTSLQVTQPLYAGGAITAGINAGRDLAEAADYRMERAIQELAYTVHEHYLNVLLAVEHVALMEQVVDTVRAHVSQAQAYFDTGFIMEADLLQAKVVLGEMEQELIRARNNEQLARAALNNVMGVSQDLFFSLTDVAEVQQSVKELNLLVKEALTYRPDLEEMRRKVSASGHQVAVERSEYKPKVALVGQLNYHDDTLAGTDGDSYTVMAVAKFNLFNGKRTRAKVRRAQSRHDAYQQYLEQLEAGITLQVRQAYYRLEEARKRHEVAQLGKTQARENLTIREARYTSGVESTTDLLDANTAFQRAALMELQSRFDRLRSREALKFAIGKTE